MKYNKIYIITALSLLLISSLGQHALGYGGPPEQSSAGKFTVEINFDKESYSIGELITFSGSVNKYEEDRNLRISIFDSKSNLIVTQKTPVTSDTTFSHDITLDKKFLEGEYKVKAQYGSSKATVEIISFVINSSEVTLEHNLSSDASIPEWVKNNAGWWADGQIDDDSFVQGIQFMIKEGLVIIPITEQGSSSQDNKIPEWVKNNAGWWADGQIDDDSFLQGIQFMIIEGLMKISN
jgi:hypothetical protein